MNACPALAASAPTMSMKPGARYLASPVGSVALTWAPADAARPAVRITEMTSSPATRLVVALSDKMRLVLRPLRVMRSIVPPSSFCLDMGQHLLGTPDTGPAFQTRFTRVTRSTRARAEDTGLRAAGLKLVCNAGPLQGSPSRPIVP